MTKDGNDDDDDDDDDDDGYDETSRHVISFIKPQSEMYIER